MLGYVCSTDSLRGVGFVADELSDHANTNGLSLESKVVSRNTKDINK